METSNSADLPHPISRGAMLCVELPTGRVVKLPVAVFVLIAIIVMVVLGRSDTEAVTVVLAAATAAREFNRAL